MAVIRGDGRDNLLRGTSGDDLIEALGGNDRIRGGPGRDLIDAGDGDDTVFWLPSDGNDTIDGDAGLLDRLQVGVRDNPVEPVVVEVTGRDRALVVEVESASGVERLRAAGMEELLVLGSTDGDRVSVALPQSRFLDLMVDVGDGDDVVDATGSRAVFETELGGGSDVFRGGSASDYVSDSGGGAGRLIGGGGDDVLVSGSDDALLVGGNGDDALQGTGSLARVGMRGGEGDDYFLLFSGTASIATGPGRDRVLLAGDTLTVTDYRPGVDGLILEVDFVGRDVINAALDTDGDGLLDRGDDTVIVRGGSMTVDFTPAYRAGGVLGRSTTVTLEGLTRLNLDENLLFSGAS